MLLLVMMLLVMVVSGCFWLMMAVALAAALLAQLVGFDPALAVGVGVEMVHVSEPVGQFHHPLVFPLHLCPWCIPGKCRNPTNPETIVAPMPV